MNTNLLKAVLVLILLVLAIVIALFVVRPLMQETNTNPVDDTNREEAERIDRAAVINTERDAFSDYNRANALFEQERNLEAIRGFKAVIAEPAYERAYRIRANAVNKLVSIYNNEPTDEVFNEIFTGEPAIFVEALAAPDVEPNQIDVSLINLHRAAIDIYPTAEALILVANSFFNHNTELYLKLFNACQEMEDVAVNGCQHDLDTFLTADERVLFDEIESEFEAYMEAAEQDIERLDKIRSWSELAWIDINRVRVLHKSMYFGFTSPDEVEDAVNKMILDSQRSGNRFALATTRIEAAIFYTLLWRTPDAEQLGVIENFLSALYDGGELEEQQSWYVERLISMYSEVEDGKYSIRQEMAMRGTLAVAGVSEEFKNFLITKAGWDFDGVAIQRIMSNATGT